LRYSRLSDNNKEGLSSVSLLFGSEPFFRQHFQLPRCASGRAKMDDEDSQSIHDLIDDSSTEITPESVEELLEEVTASPHELYIDDACQSNSATETVSMEQDQDLLDLRNSIMQFNTSLACEDVVLSLPGLKPFGCSICPLTFSRRELALRHESVHKEKNFTCQKCMKKFAYKTNLIRHMSTVHIVEGGVRKHACSICEKTFFNSSDLKRHEEIHLRKRPHICQICGRKFGQKSHLKNHITKVHPVL